MCGIFGSVGFPPNRGCIDIVSHRGPDGSGWSEYSSPAGPVAIGHRRLAIIDVSSAGLQPMSDRSGRYQLTFNGEIYNYVELREELEAKGCVFRSNSDSEVLLAAYLVWGDKCLNRLRGMFAFLIWDDREKTFFAARDRFGMKPLYVLATGRGVAFASEIKQLLKLMAQSPRMNLARVHDFLVSGICDHTDETMFEGIKQIQPGCCTFVDASEPWKGYVEQRRWYAIPAHSPLTVSENDAAECFRELLTDSIRIHLRSDVPVGSCLSGGLDSSSIVCLIADLLEKEGKGATVNTVSACYADESVDERPFMESVVAKTGARPHYVFPRAEDVFEKASEITWHQDEPFGSTSIFAQWCVFSTAREARIKVMLDGQGADEQLAGYHSSYMYYMADLVRQRKYMTLIRTMIERHRVHGASFRDQAQRLIVPLLPSGMRALLLRWRSGLFLHDWMNSPALASYQSSLPAMDLASEINDLPRATDIPSLCLVHTFAANLPMLLHWEDRTSMAQSIEARLPFLDHPLVEFSLALSDNHKIVRSETKRVLRRALTHRLPESVRKRRDKLGFATPENAWFRGPLKNLITDGVETTLRRFPELLNPRGTRALTSDMLEQRRPIDFALWRIVNMGIWGERFSVSL